MTARPDQLDHAMVHSPRERAILGHPNFPYIRRDGVRTLFRDVEPENTSHRAGIGVL
jgi:hypothetical protein